MNITSIASGSSGNCIYVSNESKGFLIDAGISKKRILEGLEGINVYPDKISGILITHEHIDHVKGLGVFLRQYPVPVYATDLTIKALRNSTTLGKVDTDLFCPIQKDREFKLSDFLIRPIGVSHDAVDPVAYRFEEGSASAAVATDMGYFDEYIIDNLLGLDAILLEANHDLSMLQSGPYPYKLKQRIWGNKGHLSNETAGRLLGKIVNKKLKNVLLGHLSNDNNYPELAFETVRHEVNAMDGEYNSNDFNLIVARRDLPTDTIIV